MPRHDAGRLRRWDGVDVTRSYQGWLASLIRPRRALCPESQAALQYCLLACPVKSPPCVKASSQLSIPQWQLGQLAWQARSTVTTLLLAELRNSFFFSL
jgi:hypothetical protein